MIGRPITAFLPLRHSVVVAAFYGLASTTIAVDLQAVLDRGDDLLLEPGTVYEVTETLRLTAPGCSS